MDIQKTTIPEFLTGAGTVGVSRVQLPRFPIVKSVTIKAAVGNGGLIYVGGSGVTTSDGYQLAANEEVEIPIDRLDKVYLIATAPTQGYSWSLS